MPCKYCGEKDESRLLISSRLVNGEVMHIDLCLRCFWIEKFRAEDGILQEARRDNGKTIRRKARAAGMDQAY